ncbi:VapC toxin family PIN domain ribonuclease [Halobacteriales archaeon QS_1_68_20]|nr:MAG: VapC toxin family PIN domain ribonuclease [Halobacteriales archaeon QS_1_68_20]
MTVFVDTNVFVANLTDEPERGKVETELLNRDFDVQTSLPNLMELRTVLTKKKQIEKDEVRSTIEDIEDRVDPVFHDTSDLLAANRIQQDELLYPMDCLILARDQNARLVTFDTELIDAGASTPETILSEEA